MPVDKASTWGHRPSRWRQLRQRYRCPPLRLLHTTQHLLSHPPHRSITRKQSTPQATHSQATSATHCWTQRRQPSSGWHQAAGHPWLAWQHDSWQPAARASGGALSCGQAPTDNLSMRPQLGKSLPVLHMSGTAANTMRWRQRADQRCRPQGWQIALEGSPHQRLPGLPAGDAAAWPLPWLAGHSHVQKYLFSCLHLPG